MATRDAEGRLELTPDENSALFSELSALHERVYGGPVGCFSGSSEELLDMVQELRGKAGAQSPEREAE